MYHSISRRCYDKRYFYLSPLGLLRSKICNLSEPSIVCKQLPAKAQIALSYIDNPYRMKIIETPVCTDIRYGAIVKGYARLLVWLYRHCYPGLWLLSHLRLGVFDNAKDAVDVFCKIIPENQKILCLPRSIFASTLSKRFKRHGAMIIGAFLPTHLMHAYVIEDGCNAFRGDSAWINFAPVSIMI